MNEVQGLCMYTEVRLFGFWAPWYADGQMHENLLADLSTWRDLLLGNASASVIIRHFAHKAALNGAQPMSMNWFPRPSV